MKHSCNIFKKGVILAVASAILGNSIAYAAPEVTTISDNNLLISSIFDEDEDIEIKNVKVLRYDTSYPYFKHMGSFSGAKEKIGIEKGVVLSNAIINNIFSGEPTHYSDESDRPIVDGSVSDSTVNHTSAAPAEESGQSYSDSLINFNAPGDEDEVHRDEDIEKINGNVQSNDVVSIEFDVVPKGKKLSFNYVFASQGIMGDRAGNTDLGIQERYKGGTAMGIWVNGKNTAFIPGTNLPVNSVNIDDSGKYIEYQGDNDHPDFLYPTRTPAFSSESAVEPNKSNHIKIAFANALERGMDSALFINGKFSDFSTEPEEVEEKPVKEEPEPVIENPKTSDINLFMITASTLASALGLSALIKRRNK